MADSLNRIVPPSVPLDRSSALGRERGKKNRDGLPKREGEGNGDLTPPAVTEAIEERKDDLGESEKEKTKGKRLDVNV